MDGSHYIPNKKIESKIRSSNQGTHSYDLHAKAIGERSFETSRGLKTHHTTEPEKQAQKQTEGQLSDLLI